MTSLLHWLWNGVSRLMRGGFLVAFDFIVLLPIRGRTPQKEGAIFCLHGLGDLLLAGNAIERLAVLMRSRGLLAILYVDQSLVDFAQCYFDVDIIEGIDRHRFSKPTRYRIDVLRRIANRFQIAVQPTYNRMLRVEDCLIRVTGAKDRIGSIGHAPFITSFEKSLGDRFYTRLVAQSPMPMHELLRYSEFMSALELPISSEPWRLQCETNSSFSLPEAYMIVCPTASAAKRSWVLAKFLQTAQDISQRYGVGIVVIGSDASAGPINRGDITLPPLVDLRGKTKTQELPALLAGAKLILSNDSGIYHMGVSVGVPTVAVGGSGIPERYFPYPNEDSLQTKAIFTPVACAGCNWRCRYHIARGAGAPCIESVECRTVIAAIGSLMDAESSDFRGLPIANSFGDRHL